jgi:hypothetical protein
MNRAVGPLFVALSVLLLAFLGCSDDAVVPTDVEQGGTSGLIEGDINEAAGSFEYTTDAAGDPRDPIAGLFIIRGKNIHYVDSLSALSVDFTVEHQNRCRCEFPEPIGMTFVNLIPQGVTVENPDNDVHGPGAAIVFEFENDDGVWSPFEESLPRTVLFGVDHGVSIGFVARIDIGTEPELGSIGGVVWNDLNEDGLRDEDESGIVGVEIQMIRTDGPEVSNQSELLWHTLTHSDGSYRFDGLSAGHYEVHRLPRSDLRATTDPMMQVILVEENGEVSDFLMADFGCVLTPPQRPIIEVGDFVDVWGDYVVRPDHHVVARAINLIKCQNDTPQELAIPPSLASDGVVDLDVCDLPIGSLTGPVTDLNRDARVMWVLGTPIHFEELPPDTVPADSSLAPRLPGEGDLPPGEKIDFEDVELGDQVTVIAINIRDHRTLDGLEIYRDDNPTFAPDIQVHGKVEEILLTPNGVIDAFVAMRTTVVLTELTRIIIAGP